MKTLYIIIISIAIIIVIMLVATFFYLDQQRHQVFLYALYYDNVLSGYEKVDRYILENSVIFKSATEFPRDILNRKTERKISFSARGKNFADYTKETLSNGAEGMVHIVNENEKVSFVTTRQGDFAYLDSIPTYGNDIPFEITSTATYPPLIQRYNFKKRGKQYINVLIPMPNLLPPARNTVSIISMGKDTVEIANRKIGCERLILVLKNGDYIFVRVTRTFHNLLTINMPKYKFKAVFSTKKQDIPVKEYTKKSGLYVKRDVTFAEEDVELHGTLSLPQGGNGPYPGVLLIWDSGPLDRNALGIFTDMAHALAKAGYCVLSFDKRGIGQSMGLFSTYAQPEEISDLKYAVQFLKLQPEVDASRIALLGHSEGGFYAAYLAGMDDDVRACVILSALSSLSPFKNNNAKIIKFAHNASPNDKEYIKSAIGALEQSRSMIQDKDDWITVLGKSVFTKKVALEGNYDPVDAIEKVKVPVLILHGRNDNINLISESEELSAALAESGNNQFTVIYFGELNHIFGKIVKNSPVRDHIELDAETLRSIVAWLDENLISPPALERKDNEPLLERLEHEEAVAEEATPEESMPKQPQIDVIEGGNI